MVKQALADNPSDEQLTADVCAGGVAADRAYEKFHERYGRMLLGYVTARCPRGWDAEALAQEVWLRAFRKRQQFTGGSFRAWVFTIASNLVKDQSRKKRPEQLGEIDPPQHEDDDPLAEHRLALKECAEALSDDQRAIVQARLKGLSFEQISELLQIPAQTAMTRFHRAKEKLRECIEKKLR